MQKIIVDYDVDTNGNIVSPHIVEFDRIEELKVSHPDKPGEKLHRIDFISWLNDNKHRHQECGWSEKSHVPGIPEGHTRWNVLVDACNHPLAHVDLQALKLTHK